MIDAPARRRRRADDGDAGVRRPSGSRRAPDWFDRLEYWVGLAIVAACCIYVFVAAATRRCSCATPPSPAATPARTSGSPTSCVDHFLPWRVAGLVERLLRGVPGRAVLLPVPGAAHRRSLDVVLPYNVAFKLVTALGPVAAAGRRVRVRPRASACRGRRAPLFAVAATAFLFFKDGGDATMTFDHHIMGGTLASTLAGEYSFTIALALSLFFLGTLARALDRRGPLWLPAVLLALTLTSHLVVGDLRGVRRAS